MAAVDEILALPCGARFYRADLHVHSFNASHDVRDATLVPQAIVTTALAERLDVLAVADHNAISNVEPTMNAAAGTSLLVIPAVELSTSAAHLLCYLPTMETLRKFFARLEVVDQGTSTSRCQTSLLDCLRLLAELSGFGVLAHVDGPGGFEVETPGNSPHKRDVLCHRALLGIELKDASSPISYGDGDPDQNRAAFGSERIRQLGLGSRQYLARILNSDAHSLESLGRNARGDRRVTRFKMDQPSFDSLRIALEDSDARVRIEDQIPATVPYAVGVKLEGGFLAEQAVRFSPNLNCIIGGRGTGKSTMFEVIRCLAGQASDSGLVDSEVWPNEVTLLWRDQAGQVHALARTLGGDVTNIDDPSHGPISFPVESYGQGETAHVSKRAQDNPLALLEYLDRFVEIDQELAEENEARDDLLSLQSEIEKASKNVDMIPQHERALSTTQKQLAALEQVKAREIIVLQRKVAAEREVRTQLALKLKGIEQQLDCLSPRAAVEEIAGLADQSTLAVGAAEYGAIVASARAFETEAHSAQGQAKASYQKLRTAAEIQLASWKAKEVVALGGIEAKRKELEAQNIRLDMAYIQKLASDEAKLRAELGTLRALKPHLIALRRRRSATSSRRWEAHDRVANKREAFAKAASETLRAALSDLVVSLKFRRSAYSPDAERQIVEAMGWRTIQVPRAALMLDCLTLPGLLAAIDRKNPKALLSVTTEEGARVFDRAEADRIISRLSEPATRFGLERCEVFDLPHLTVTKPVQDANGKTVYLTRSFSKLSLGQQQSVLLALMLSSKRSTPLIIDQPEDNLDGEFIYNSLVPVLRLAKERRQIIVVTHNANIAVLGDAEQIVVLKSTADMGKIVSRGSIDDPATREAACNILEGAREAFRRRARIYGMESA